MANYVFPTTSVEILDGQLLTSVSIPSDATLIIDVAEKGPTDRLYFVGDAKDASSIFGTNSPLVQSMQRAFRTGVTNILLYRIGGTSPTIENIFGEDTYIQTLAASVSADSDLKVYIGPEPLNPTVDCIIIFNKDKIVYSNTVASPVNLSAIEVEGFDKVDNEIYVGSFSNPVPFSQVVNEVGERIVHTGTASPVALGASYDPQRVSTFSQSIKANGVRLNSSQYTITNTGSAYELTITDTNIASQTPLEIEYSYVKKLVPLNITVTDSFDMSTHTGPVTLTATEPFDVRTVPHSATILADNAVDTITLTDDQYTITVSGSTYTITLTDTNLLVGEFDFSFIYNDIENDTTEYLSKLKYISGEDLINANYQTLYEAFDTALVNLELIPVKSVVLPDLVTVPNVAFGDAPDETLGRLSYLNVIEEDEERFYEWSDSKFVYRKGNETTTNIAEADLTANGQPIVYKQYHQVDFVHRAGTWAFEKNSEGIYPNIIIGDKGPTTYSKKQISRWVGKSPVRDLDNNIIENGSGLLGHPLMIGTTTYSGGYFATDSGFVDGNPIPDSNGFIVDLGKYLSLVISHTIPSSSSVLSYTKSGSADYAGLVDTVTPGNGTTNQVIPNTFLLTPIKSSKIKELSEAGYVVFKDDLNRGVVVVSGDLATRENSDYDYLGTALVVAAVVRDLYDISGPFLGRGIDGLTLSTLQTALVTRMTNRQTDGWFNSFALQVIQTGPNSIQIGYVIDAKDELREIAATIKLNRQMFTDING